MKKIILTVLMTAFVFACSAQRSKPKSDFVLNQRMYEQFSPQDIEDMYNNDFARLFRLNYRLTNMVRVATKYDGDVNMLQSLETYAKQGVTSDEAEIISSGFVNYNLYDLPQDETRTNVVPLRTPGFYILILSKDAYEAAETANLKEYVY